MDVVLLDLRLPAWTASPCAGGSGRSATCQSSSCSAAGDVSTGSLACTQAGRLHRQAVDEGELVARIYAVLRRGAAPIRRRHDRETIAVGDVEIHLSRHEVVVAGEPLRCPKQFQLVTCRPGRVVRLHEGADHGRGVQHYVRARKPNWTNTSADPRRAWPAVGDRTVYEVGYQPGRPPAKRPLRTARMPPGCWACDLARRHGRDRPGRPLAVSVASSEGQQVLLDRSPTRTVSGPWPSIRVPARLPLPDRRADPLRAGHGVQAAVLDINQHVVAHSSTSIDLTDPNVRDALRQALVAGPCSSRRRCTRADGADRDSRAGAAGREQLGVALTCPAPSTRASRSSVVGRLGRWRDRVIALPCWPSPHAWSCAGCCGRCHRLDQATATISRAVVKGRWTRSRWAAPAPSCAGSPSRFRPVGPRSANASRTRRSSRTRRTAAYR